MKLHIGVGLEPMFVFLVGVEVVEDDVKLSTRKGRGDAVHEVEKLDAATSLNEPRGFAGEHKDPGRAAFRPTGLAMGPDGAIYICEDVHGRIWRVTYRGDAATARLAAAPALATASGPAARPPRQSQGPPLVG